ncbi:hypothetical protein V2G26_016884 [Clonostachys chloroleuca]
MNAAPASRGHHQFLEQATSAATPNAFGTRPGTNPPLTLDLACFGAIDDTRPARNTISQVAPPFHGPHHIFGFGSWALDPGRPLTLDQVALTSTGAVAPVHNRLSRWCLHCRGRLLLLND